MMGLRHVHMLPQSFVNECTKALTHSQRSPRSIQDDIHTNGITCSLLNKHASSCRTSTCRFRDICHSRPNPNNPKCQSLSEVLALFAICLLDLYFRILPIIHTHGPAILGLLQAENQGLIEWSNHCATALNDQHAAKLTTNIHRDSALVLASCLLMNLERIESLYGKPRILETGDRDVLK